MSENNRLLDGTPIAEFDDVIEFLAERSTLPCPSCGHMKWTVFTSQENKNVHAGMGLSAMQLDTGSMLSKAVPVVVTTCRKCSYLKLHSFTEICKWAAAGKPPFIDDSADDDE